MATTTNNGWTTPDNTDLVKDGALAIRTLGNAIDTTLGVYAAPGLVHINTTTLSASSSQTFTTFYSTTYDTYKVLVNVYSSSSGAEFRFRFRNASGDITTGYYGAGYQTDYLGAAGNKNPKNNAAEAVFGLLSSVAGHESFISFEIGSFSAQKSHQVMGAMNQTQDGSNRTFGYYEVGGATDLTGFTIYPSAGTITGSVKIYGYRK